MRDIDQISRKKATRTPERFQVNRWTLFVDRLMNQLIKVGGLGVILAVFGILIFILSQILPLFQRPRVTAIDQVQIPASNSILMGVDEWGIMPFFAVGDGSLYFMDLQENGINTNLFPNFSESRSISAVDYNQETQQLVYGSNDGKISVVTLEYDSTYGSDGKRRISPKLEVLPWIDIGATNGPLIAVAYADNGSEKIAAAIQEIDGRRSVHVATLTQSRSLLGSGETVTGSTYSLTEKIQGTPNRVLVNKQAEGIIVSTTEGEVYYFFAGESGFDLRQVFKPFADLSEPRISAMQYLLGDVSLAVVGSDGKNRIFSLFIPKNAEARVFNKIREFRPCPAPASFVSASLRNKAFLVCGDQYLSLRYGTTEQVRWQEQVKYNPRFAILNGKSTRILALDDQGILHRYEVEDHHPESSLKAMFGKIWYEGSSEPKYEWQSTGGTDDFEPKLSLIPLIIGSLKGTFYALIFAVPVSLLAALYTSQFMARSVRGIIKPTMEIMASLPSVVLGFLAALYVAPLIETRVPSLLLMFISVPLMTLAFAWMWVRMPLKIRKVIPSGCEFLVIMPILYLVTVLCWNLGPVLEQWLFVVKDAETGKSTADFRLWWPQVTGLAFEQRNSLVVGFMMGFAVMPIIFTIAEDALSNVPPALRSGSLALGASRWQTAVKIVIPTASAGIFSAIMIGFGRAIGETMIVVMATGNTPIMDMNIFSGMRTLSANIAVELPEAPAEGTLYRILFFGGMVLFLFTFVVNTVAEILRQHLRNKYKTV